MYFFIQDSSLMSTKNGNIISSMTREEINNKILSVLLDKVLDFIKKRLAGCDMTADAAYICF